MNAFQLVSELYRILGAVDRATLEEAERIAESRRLRAVIRALVFCVRAHPAGARQPGLSTSGQPRQDTALPVAPTADGQLAQVLSESGRRLNGRDLVLALKRVGIDLPMRPKDGQIRLLHRAAAKLAQMPEDRRTHTLSALRDHLGVDQTAGWMKVIRGDRP